MSSQIKLQGDIIGLDLGAARTGVARISSFAKIAEPLKPIVEKVTPILGQAVRQLELEYRPCAFVVGLPRGLDGQETDQTRLVRKIVDELQSEWVNGATFFLIDEAGTTKEAELRANPEESVDSVAACIILEDFVSQVMRGKIDNVSI